MTPPRAIPRARLDALFSPERLQAWCVVPYDGMRRGPRERARMLADLGIGSLAWDWRAEHLPQLGAELDALEQAGVHLGALWLPAPLARGGDDDPVRTAILDTLAARGLAPQLWTCTMYGGIDAPRSGDPLPAAAQLSMITRHVEVLLPLARDAARIGSTVGLYNHLGWFGEPDHQLDVLDALADLGSDNVGLVYNQHHGHHHLEDPDRFARLWARIRPRVLAVNLNGTVRGGDLPPEQGGPPPGELGGGPRKVVAVGQGDPELELAALRTIAGSEWDGQVGVIGHTFDDARARLADDLDGLAWLVEQLAEPDAAAPPRPSPRVRL
ncbi:MAG: hypothetical protein U0Q15_05365 [Kineosporiaceae bacterium]